MIHQFHLHESFLHLIKKSNSIQTKPTGAYLLKALLGPSPYKCLITSQPIIRASDHLWSLTSSPHLQYLGVALTLHALEGSFPVLEQLIAPLSPDPDSPVHSKIHLSILLRLWDDYYGYKPREKLVFAIAWIVATVCGILWSSS